MKIKLKPYGSTLECIWHIYDIASVDTGEIVRILSVQKQEDFEHHLVSYQEYKGKTLFRFFAKVGLAHNSNDLISSQLLSSAYDKLYDELYGEVL